MRNNPSETESPSAVPRQAWTVFSLLLAINLFNYIDRQVLYAVFPLIKTDLNLSDAALGFLGSSFMLVYMLCAPGIGYMADRGRRPLWLGAGTIIWSFATALAGLTRSYAQLLFARSAVGVGEAAYTTIAPAYLSEYFPAHMRARIMAFFTAATPVGSAAGYMLGGLIAQHWGWRAAFYAVGIPGLFLGVLALRLKDNLPPQTKDTAPKLREYAALFSNKTFLLTTLAVSAATFTLGGLAAWMPSYFTRYFGYSVGQAGLTFGALTVAAGLLGTLIGGWAADMLARKTDKAYFLVSAAGFLASIPLGLAALNANSNFSALALFFCAILAVFMHSGPLNAAIIAVSPGNMRSMAFAAFIFTMHALGDAVSPTLIGALSDQTSLKFAVSACICVLGMAALFCLIALLPSRKIAENPTQS